VREELVCKNHLLIAREEGREPSCEYHDFIEIGEEELENLKKEVDEIKQAMEMEEAE
jgi:hypothetical protein